MSLSGAFAAAGGHKKRSADAATLKPAGVGWHEVFEVNRPENVWLLATVELRDGRKFVGQVAAFSPTAGDNRELVLGKNIAGGPPGGIIALEDDYIMFREQDIAYVAVRYREKP